MDWRDPAIAAGIAAALGSVFGGLITGAFTVWPLKQEIKRNGYIHLDATYNTIIDRSAKYPEFSDAKLVSVYADAFKDKLQEYEAYAWLGKCRSRPGRASLRPMPKHSRSAPSAKISNFSQAVASGRALPNDTSLNDPQLVYEERCNDRSRLHRGGGLGSGTRLL